MAQTGFTPIQLYYSTTATNVPLAGNLAAGELALNTVDEKLYFKNNAGVVTLIASSSGAVATVSNVSWTGGIVSIATPTTTPAFTIAGTSGGVPYFSSASTWASSGALTQYGIVYGGGAGGAPVATAAGATNQVLKANTGGAPTWGSVALATDVSGTLPSNNGGTGVDSYAVGDMLYYSAGTALTKLTIGTNTQILASNGSVPVWVDASSVSVNTATNLAGGATGSVPFQSGVGATTFLALGTAGQVMTAGPSGPQYVNQSTLSVGFATNATDAVNATNAATSTNLAGGTANQIPFQTGAGSTSFVVAPSSANFVLTWTGSAFNWASVPSVTAAGNLLGGAAGDLVFQSATNASAFLPDIAVGNALISGGVGVAPSYGKIGLTTHVSGVLPTANGGTNLSSFTSGGAVYATSTSALTTGTLPISGGGTNSTATPTSGAIAYGTGTAFAFTTPGTAGQALVSGGAGAPVWQDFPQVPSFLLINAGVS